jgi:tryptophan synthase alpha chain
VTAASGRLADLFRDGAKRLIGYVTCGDPSPAASVDIVRAAADAGADAIELGIPYSDPSADGPAIQLAMQRALAAGASLSGTLDTVRRVRAAGCRVPIILFGYYNPIFVRGPARFCAEAAAAGADAVLAVDLPVDEIAELADPARAAGLDVIPLLAPTSSPPRMAQVAALAPPFVYYVSLTGVTGAKLTAASALAARLAEVRAAVHAPIAVGFGIATPADARAVAHEAGADAVVVGTAIVRAIERSPANAPSAVADLVRTLKAAL